MSERSASAQAAVRGEGGAAVRPAGVGSVANRAALREEWRRIGRSQRGGDQQQRNDAQDGPKITPTG